MWVTDHVFECRQRCMVKGIVKGTTLKDCQVGLGGRGGGVNCAGRHCG
mgnify:CR=1 FL=1